MTKKGDWKLKRRKRMIKNTFPTSRTEQEATTATQVQQQRGRGRSRKRSLLYQNLSLYHNTFLDHLTKEYKIEVS